MKNKCPFQTANNVLNILIGVNVNTSNKNIYHGKKKNI